MLISNFELLVKRIAPLSGGPADDAFRRVVQGYFVQVTNLEPNFLILRLEYTFSIVNILRPFDRELTLASAGNPANVVLTLDIADTNNFALPATISTGAFTRTLRTNNFLVPPAQTASIKLLPNIGETVLLNTENMEVKGYAEIFQGAIISNPNARVLVTPEIRGTFLDNEYPTGAPVELDFDQINYTLPLATGRAQNFVPLGSPLAASLQAKTGRNGLDQVIGSKEHLDALKREMKAGKLEVPKFL